MEHRTRRKRIQTSGEPAVLFCSHINDRLLEHGDDISDARRLYSRQGFVQVVEHPSHCETHPSDGRERPRRGSSETGRCCEVRVQDADSRVTMELEPERNHVDELHSWR